MSTSSAMTGHELVTAIINAKEVAETDPSAGWRVTVKLTELLDDGDDDIGLVGLAVTEAARRDPEAVSMLTMLMARLLSDMATGRRS